MPAVCSLIPEMEPLGFEVEPLPLAATAVERAEREAVRREFIDRWVDLAPKVAEMAGPDTLVDLSRWAVAETEEAAAEPGGLTIEPASVRALPMRMLGRSAWGDSASEKADGQVARRILWGIEPEESPWRLPTHHPLVRRSVVFYALTDATGGRIETIILTIRGWAEE